MCRQQLVLYSELIDTEWLIGINLVTGGVLCAADSSWFFTVSLL